MQCQPQVHLLLQQTVITITSNSLVMQVVVEEIDSSPRELPPISTLSWQYVLRRRRLEPRVVVQWLHRIHHPLDGGVIVVEMEEEEAVVQVQVPHPPRQ